MELGGSFEEKGRMIIIVIMIIMTKNILIPFLEPKNTQQKVHHIYNNQNEYHNNKNQHEI